LPPQVRKVRPSCRGLRRLPLCLPCSLASRGCVSFILIELTFSRRDVKGKVVQETLTKARVPARPRGRRCLRPGDPPPVARCRREAFGKALAHKKSGDHEGCGPRTRGVVPRRCPARRRREPRHADAFLVARSG